MRLAHGLLNSKALPKPRRMALCGAFATGFLAISALGQLSLDQNAKKSEKSSNMEALPPVIQKPPQVRRCLPMTTPYLRLRL